MVSSLSLVFNSNVNEWKTAFYALKIYILRANKDPQWQMDFSHDNIQIMRSADTVYSFEIKKNVLEKNLYESFIWEKKDIVVVELNFAMEEGVQYLRVARKFFRIFSVLGIISSKINVFCAFYLSKTINSKIFPETLKQ